MLDDGSTAAAIAEFLAQHEGLGFPFCNACSTVGHVHALLTAGVPEIVATEFSSQLYEEFVSQPPALDDWPWKLHVREGNKNADQGSLGDVLDTLRASTTRVTRDPLSAPVLAERRQPAMFTAARRAA